ncbi:MAG: glycosyltransferase family 2 protein [Planctomycetes bacterium]|nr:glycosyltransferase family 2 protein [Planctomycetota bacterium]
MTDATTLEPTPSAPRRGPAASEARPRVSVVLPCFNEEECIESVAREVVEAMTASGEPFELLLVDDASTDRTLDAMGRVASAAPQARILRHAIRSGQSAAQATGFRAALGEIVVTLDADGQNPPHDIPKLLMALAPGIDAVCGVRRTRHDNFVRKLSSKIGNGFRNWVTGHHVTDAGCAFRAIRRDALNEVPVFNGLHRFLPTLLTYQGFRVAEVDVGHRPRKAGVSKYGIGNRMFRGIADCIAMRWWRRRAVLARRTLGT